MTDRSDQRQGAARDEELEMLLALLDRLGVEVRIEPCQSDGGLVRLAGRPILFLNAGAEHGRWKKICMEALGRFDLSGVHVPPRIRELLGGQSW
jgi:hypothetical protein